MWHSKLHNICIKQVLKQSLYLGFYLFIYLFIYNLALNLTSAGCSHVGLLFTNEEQKKSGS